MNTPYPVTWLLKNGYPRVEIYQHLYRNYDALVRAVDLPLKKEIKQMDLITYFACILGLKTVKWGDEAGRQEK